MRHRDYFQRTGLATMFLAAGLLGGLAAPVSSDAQTTPAITIDFDGLGPVAVPVNPCATIPTGYTGCWEVLTTELNTATGTMWPRIYSASNGRKYAMTGYASTTGTSPRVLVNDVSGSELDQIIFSNVEISGGSGWLDSVDHFLSGAWRMADDAAVCRVASLS